MNIRHILSVEKLRDGGSLVVRFQAKDSCEYWLALPIKLEGSSEEYFPPVLINKTTDIEVDYSWNDARSCLQALESFLQEEDRTLFNNIQRVAYENT